MRSLAGGTPAEAATAACLVAAFVCKDYRLAVFSENGSEAQSPLRSTPQLIPSAQ